MILDDPRILETKSRGSHFKINVKCDFGCSPNCKQNYKIEIRRYYKVLKQNNNKLICLQCSRFLKSRGRNNPNCKYMFDDNYFSDINSLEKAYFLGWIAGDGHVSKRGFSISLHEKDKYILFKLKNLICADLPIRLKQDSQVVLSVNSQKIAKDISDFLNINFGKKADKITLPSFSSNEMTWAFIRGLFEADGSIRSPLFAKYPRCSISSSSDAILSQIKDFCGIPCSVYKQNIEWNSSNALDFLSKIYDDIDLNLYLDRKFELYCQWCSYVPGLSGFPVQRELSFKWQKTCADAQPPFKSRASDSGYDITIINKIKDIGIVSLYETGIKVRPDFGWYFDLVGRSSIIKSGYIVANSFGVIDRTYTGSIKVPLIKIDKNAPDLELPSRLVQIIPRPIIHMKVTEVSEEEFDRLKSERSSGGFGSTGGFIKYGTTESTKNS